MNRNFNPIVKLKRYLHSYSKNDKTQLYQPNATLKWPTKEVRKTFVDHFCAKNKHKFIYSSSVVPRKGSGTYFTNAGMNQFKSIILGEVSSSDIIDYSKYIGAANSQKCIRIGGKHSDLDTIGKDDNHHTFFEMLGNWSFGKYGKEDACRFALELLVDTFKLDLKRLYFTYFGGNEELKLGADLETKQIWEKLGVPAANILPFGMKDNFWEMDVTGPCGPCTEIHYDRTASSAAASLVNKGDERVIELWNLVFMQYNRLSQKSFIDLPELVVDTGAGLERLSAVLNNLHSNYEIDLFTPIFSQIEAHLKENSINLPTFYQCDANSELKYGYRTLADHMRTICVSISDGLVPTRTGLGGYLRFLILKCMRICNDTFQIDKERSAVFLASLVPAITDSLKDSYAQLDTDRDRIQEVIRNSYAQYKSKAKRSEEIINRFLHKLNNPKALGGEEIWRLYKGDGSGEDVPMEFIETMASKKAIQLDRDAFDKILISETEKSLRTLKNIRYENTQLISMCTRMKREFNIPVTNDSFKYNFALDHKKHVARYKDGELVAKIICLIRVTEDGNYEIVEEVEDGDRCIVVLDHSNFYSEKGGQQSDSGNLYLIKDDSSHVKITHVQSLQDYVLHFGRFKVSKNAKNKHARLAKNEYCNCKIDEKKRYNATLSHTGIHVLNDSLRRYYKDEDSVIQVNSQARETNLKFEFLFNKISKFSKPSFEDIAAIERQCQLVIDSELPVYESEADFENAASARKLRDVLYPFRVRVVSVGNKETPEGSFHELCCGTHADNTRDLRSLVITSLNSNGDISYEFDACVGSKAAEIAHNEMIISDIYNEIKEVDASTIHGMHEIARKCIQIELFTQHWQLSYAFRHNLKKNLEKFRPSKNKLQKILNEFFHDEILNDLAIDAEDLNMKFIHYDSILPIEQAIQALSQVENIPSSLLLLNKFRKYLIAYSYIDADLVPNHDRMFDLIDNLLTKNKIEFERLKNGPNISVFKFDRRTKPEKLIDVCRNVEKI